MNENDSKELGSISAALSCLVYPHREQLSGQERGLLFRTGNQAHKEVAFPTKPGRFLEKARARLCMPTQTIKLLRLCYNEGNNIRSLKVVNCSLLKLRAHSQNRHVLHVMFVG